MYWCWYRRSIHWVKGIEVFFGNYRCYSRYGNYYLLLDFYLDHWSISKEFCKQVQKLNNWNEWLQHHRKAYAFRQRIWWKQRASQIIHYPAFPKNNNRGKEEQRWWKNRKDGSKIKSRRNLYWFRSYCQSSLDTKRFESVWLTDFWYRWHQLWICWHVWIWIFRQAISHEELVYQKFDIDWKVK